VPHEPALTHERNHALDALTDIALAVQGHASLHYNAAPGQAQPWTCQLVWTEGVNPQGEPVAAGTFFAASDTFTGSIDALLDQLEAAFPDPGQASTPQAPQESP